MAMPWPPRGNIRAAPNWNSSCPSSARIMLFCPPMKERILTYLWTERNVFLPLKTFNNNNRKQIKGFILSLATFSFLIHNPFQLYRPIIFNVSRKEELK
jgi:hypothetical protein